MRSVHGFSLVELMVTISILAILSVVAMAAYSSVSARGRDAKRKQDLRAIQTALEYYNRKNNAYPTTTDWIYSNATEPWISQLDSSYIAILPVDPLRNDGRSIDNDINLGYAYWSAGNGGGSCSTQAGTWYALAAKLEIQSDPDRNELKQYKFCDGTTPSSWSPYLYVITSDN